MGGGGVEDAVWEGFCESSLEFSAKRIAVHCTEKVNPLNNSIFGKTIAMSAKERLLKEMESLSASELLLVRSLIRTLKRKSARKPLRPGTGGRKARAALRNLKTPLSDEIAASRSDRV